MRKLLPVSFFLSVLLVTFNVSADSSAKHLKPIIGISIDNGDYAEVEASKLGMIESIQASGGIPLILNDRGDRSAEKDIDRIDGLVIQGDALDVDPAQYGQKKHKETQIETDKSRTNYEDKIIKLAMHNKVPALLICGGMQRANILYGGTLHQHIPDLPGVKPGHGNNNGNPPTKPGVEVEIAADSNFAKILGKSGSDKPIPEMVNSFHHQALDKIGNGFRVVAYSDEYTRTDGTKDHLVEAIESDPKGQFAGQYILGLQSHPEVMPNNPMSVNIFHSFIDASQKFAADNGREHKDELVIREISRDFIVK